MSRAEMRLHELLEGLRRDPPQAERSLMERTLRTARWQRHARAPLQLVGHLGVAFADAARLVFGGDRRR